MDIKKYQDKLSEDCYHVLTMAVSESQHRQHYYLGVEHLFWALIHVEEEFFSELMRELSINPEIVKSSLMKRLEVARQYVGMDMKIPDNTKMVFKEAWIETQRRGHNIIETHDLFAAIFNESESMPVEVLVTLGVDQDNLLRVFYKTVKERRYEYERKKKRYELTPHLKTFGVNLNKLAWKGGIRPLIGRDKEVNQMIEILCHRERQNSVMIIGEPGVGKTALVEGLARRIELEPESIPSFLRDRQVVNIQMNTVVAGTVFRGMFEDRIEKIIKEVKDRGDIILFIDEAHTLIGAGSALGVTNDAANIFKSTLSRGEIQIIGVTTAAEYKMFIVEDEALSRRFRVIHLKEPSYDETREILKGIRPHLEKCYSARIPDGTLEKAMDFSKRYMHSLRLPDKAISWLDTASVKVDIMRDEGVGLQEEVNEGHVLKVISQETGLPLDMVKRDILERFEGLEDKLRGRVVGQDEAIDALARRLRLNKGPLKEDFYKPDGVLLFLGPTGVGKTELAKALAEFLFGDEHKMVRFDMSEYSDSSIAIDKLIGMPRGIVGSERGGILTSQIKDNPYTMVLLDEMEKAGSIVMNLFMQVFDEGWITDGRGKRVYFSDAVIIMTSNLGAGHFRRLTKPFGFLSDHDAFSSVRRAVLDELEKTFSPEFLNRIDEVIVFSPLTEEEVVEIARRYLNQIEERMKYEGKKIHIPSNALKLLARKGYSQKYGARHLKRVIDDIVKVPITLLWNKGNKFYIEEKNHEIKVRVK